MRNEWRRKIFLNIGVTILTFAALIILILLLRSDINKRVIKISSQRQELFSRAAAIDSLANLKSDFEKAKPYIAVLDRILPAKEDLISFSRDIVEIGRKSQASVGFAFGQEVEGTADQPGIINFNLSVDTSLNNLVVFLKNIKASSYIVSFPALDLSRREGEQFIATLAGRVYSR